MPYVARPQPLPVGAPAVRDSFGGHPYLPPGTPWPMCSESGKPMVLFFQFDVRPEFGLSIAPGTHFAAFMSPTVNEIDTFDRVPAGKPLPDRFWEKRLPHFKLYVFGPEVELVAHADADAVLVPHKLEFAPDDDPGDPFLYIGGEPRWYQDAEPHPGFDFVCQLSENFPFPKQDSAPVQPNTFSKKAYGLFLGNSIYVFARPKPTHPEEVWVALQN